ncbi:uncharacterized protein LOC124201994 [Daphnia pulex]|uniref:uncharacterized protein LOC124201994 n=1 Tax=Daphnia pulex TaxID=6669 RepID=UPI001EE1016E|nr:uncharacterized protein LOC124201994 [Daphnia pulex]
MAIRHIISNWPNNRSRGLKLLSILPKCRLSSVVSCTCSSARLISRRNTTEILLVGVQVGDPVAQLLQNVRTQQILSSMAGIMAIVVLLQPAGERCDRVKLSCSCCMHFIELVLSCEVSLQEDFLKWTW